MKKETTKEDFKKAFKALKSLDEISCEMTENANDLKADCGVFSLQDAKNVLHTNEPLIKKSTEHGIPDYILDIDKAKKILLQRHRMEKRRIEKCQDTIGNVLGSNDCILEGEMIIDDKIFGTITRMFAHSNGVITLRLEQEKIFVKNK